MERGVDFSERVIPGSHALTVRELQGRQNLASNYAAQLKDLIGDGSTLIHINLNARRLSGVQNRSGRCGQITRGFVALRRRLLLQLQIHTLDNCSVYRVAQ